MSLGHKRPNLKTTKTKPNRQFQIKLITGPQLPRYKVLRNFLQFMVGQEMKMLMNKCPQQKKKRKKSKVRHSNSHHKVNKHQLQFLLYRTTYKIFKDQLSNSLAPIFSFYIERALTVGVGSNFH